jgi:hypothetical protein
MCAIVAMWISASLVPLTKLRSILGHLEVDVRRCERDDCRLAEIEREDEIERLERRLAN